MQSTLLEEASKLIPDQQKLINIVSKRVRQLSQGHRPLVQVMPRMVFSDIALKELIDGKLTFRDGAAHGRRKGLSRIARVGPGWMVRIGMEHLCCVAPSARQSDL